MPKKSKKGGLGHQPAKANALPLQSSDFLLDAAGSASMHVSRRNFLAGIAGTAVATSVARGQTMTGNGSGPVNLAAVATPSTLYASGDAKLSALNDGGTPANSRDREQEHTATGPRSITSGFSMTGACR